MLRENTALPLLLLHLALESLGDRAGRTRRALGYHAASAVVLALAFCAWDLVQYYVMLWMAVRAYRAVRTGPGVHAEAGWWLHYGALLVATVMNPYLNAHGAWASLSLTVGHGIALLLVVQRRAPALANRPLRRVLVLCLPLGVLALAGSLPGENYAHFGSLLWAKIVHLNRKPFDPSCLSFDARIMWVPALHSATWSIVRALFPASLPLTCCAVCVLCTRPERLRAPVGKQLILFCGVSLLSFGLFVRFHVFLILFVAGLLGGLASWAWRRKRWLRVVLLGGIGLGLLLEVLPLVRYPERWGRPHVYYNEGRELTGWLQARDKPGPVLANFGTSASILAYAGHPIVLHPKFETPGIRKRVQVYAEKLFRQGEKEFCDWAEQLGVRYYVHGVGEFASVDPRYQMRYFAGAVEPPADVAARVFEEAPQRVSHCRYVWGNRKYRVFGITTAEDRLQAEAEAARATEAFERGDLDRAEAAALAALEKQPDQEAALEVVRHVMSLRDQGFTHQVDE
jgi:hypothetical protein